jgi:CheY-like chemotaxis protein
MTRPRLLCIDDDAGVRELYRVLFGSYGYEVVLAEDGNRALQIFRSQKFHGVVVDYEMPDLNGSEVAAMLKHESPETPVVMVSGCQSIVEDAPRFVDAAIAKGSSIGTLVDKVGMLLGSKVPPLPKTIPISRFLPLGSALATVALVGFFVPRLWR